MSNTVRGQILEPSRALFALFSGGQAVSEHFVLDHHCTWRPTKLNASDPDCIPKLRPPLRSLISIYQICSHRLWLVYLSSPTPPSPLTKMIHRNKTQTQCHSWLSHKWRFFSTFSLSRVLGWFSHHPLLGHTVRNWVRVSVLKVVWRFTPTELINFLLLNGFLHSNPNHRLLSKFSTCVAQEAQVAVNHRGSFSPTAGSNLQRAGQRVANPFRSPEQLQSEESELSLYCVNCTLNSLRKYHSFLIANPDKVKGRSC